MTHLTVTWRIWSGSTAMSEEVRVALYARASTDRQEHSIPAQLRELREHAARHGLEVVAEIRDENQKRHDLNRPGLDELRDLVESGSIESVWAWEHSRFGMFPVPEVLALELKDFGVTLRSMDDAGPGEDGEDLAVIKSLFSRREMRDRTRRTTRGRRDKARRGAIFGGFRARYGLRFVKGANRNGREITTGYEPDPEKMVHVLRIFEIVAGGGSLKSVRKEFEQAGVLNPSGGRRWSTTTIKGIVNDDVFRPHAFEEVRGIVSPEVAATVDPNKVYGISWSGRKRSKFKGRGKARVVYETDPSTWTGVPVPLADSGLDRGVVDMARERVSENKASAKVGNREWELAGVAKCAECGRNLIAYQRSKKGGGSNFYYRCRPGSTVDVCPNRRSHRAERLEWDAEILFTRTAGTGKLLELFDSAVEDRVGGNGRRDAARRRAAFAEQLEVLTRRRRKYQDQHAAELMTLDELRARLSELEEQRAGVEAELRAVQDHAGEDDRLAGMRAQLEVFREQFEATQLPGELMMWADGADRPEQVRDAYLKAGARFTVDRDGELRLFLDVGMPDGSVANGTPISTLWAPAAATSSARLA